METDVDKLLAAARLQRIESGKRPISLFLRAVAMLAIVAVMCTVFMLIRENRGAEIIYLFMGMGAIFAALFCGHGES